MNSSLQKSATKTQRADERLARVVDFPLPNVAKPTIDATIGVIGSSVSAATKYQSDELLFAEDAPEGEILRAEREPWKIMLVDDEEEVHQVTRLALRRVKFQERDLDFVSAYSAEEAIKLIDQHPDTAIILLDVVMETTHAGLEFVRYVREVAQNHLVRIILRTGQPGLAPEESIIVDYDINDYKTKTELTRTRLFTTIVAALRTYSHMVTIESTKRELELLYEDLQSVNRELEQAKNAAEHANRVKSEFLSNMSHELRTPLAVIQSKSAVFRRGFYGPITEKQDAALQIISASGRNLLGMINDLFDMSKIEAGELQLNLASVNLQELCNESMAEVLSFMEEQTANVSLSIDDAIDRSQTIYTDEQRLRQILVHLLHNAIKFSPLNSQVGLSVSSGADKQTLVFTVWDHGIGIAEEVYERIFEPFVQLDASLTRTYSGSGLGLSIIKRLLELLGGKIQVESKLGEGSRFTVTLPISSSA